MVRNDDAVGLSERISRGEISPVEAVTLSIQRIQSAAHLNCVAFDRFERAIDEARRIDPKLPFSGVPVLLKDHGAEIAGEPLYLGNQALRLTNYKPTTDSHVVRRFREAGFIIIGRTNTPEFSTLGTTEGGIYGTAVNPWDRSRSTGGSSGGAAAAVAAGLVPVAHGSDGGGSLRQPASYCNLVSLKTTRGIISEGPHRAESRSGLGTTGVLTRSVRDSIALYRILSGPEIGDPFRTEMQAPFGAAKLKELTCAIYLPTDGNVDEDSLLAVEQIARALSDLGHRVVEAQPAGLFAPANNTSSFDRRGVDMSYLANWLEATIGRELLPTDMEPINWFFVMHGRSLPADTLLKIDEEWNLLRRSILAFWGDTNQGGTGFDVLITPTTNGPAPELGVMVPRADDLAAGFSTLKRLCPFTSIFNITGQPAISIPVHRTSEGLPIGVQMVGNHNSDALLLSLALDLERTIGWSVLPAQLDSGANN